MRKLFYILILLPFLTMAQVPDLLLASYQQANSSTPIFDGQNASVPIPNEVNSAANTVDNHIGILTWSVTTSSPYDGSYALRATHGSGNNTQVAAFVTAKGVKNGDTVTIKLWLREVDGTNWRAVLRSSDGWVSSSPEFNPTSGIGVWEEWEVTATADEDDPEIEFFTTSSGDNGDMLDVDYIIIE